ncbi:MAG: hypothetical protein FWC22_05610 [Treponema sp.]|nr:hypothetical protein [Treponema sp.]
MTPEQALNRLKEGNIRYASGAECQFCVNEDMRNTLLQINTDLTLLL